ncbi:MAG: hypothetical protein KBO59_19695, partial [Achromobacter sp.]|nr:hypothetical protein [Achromobacter sp.]
MNQHQILAAHHRRFVRYIRAALICCGLTASDAVAANASEQASLRLDSCQPHPAPPEAQPDLYSWRELKMGELPLELNEQIRAEARLFPRIA